MSQLNSNFEQYLPLNRKERFFTGTVLPQIICHDNFKYFDLFLKLIPGFPDNLVIKPNADDNNIQFQTEFSLKESVAEDYIGREYVELPETKDTPDVVILITEPDLYLVVIEAKMFSSATSSDVERQMEKQGAVVNSICKTLEIKEANIFHCALVPREVIPSKSAFKFSVIYWEEIVESYKEILPNDYFLNVLDLALNNYTNLKSKQSAAFSTYGKNMDTRINGETILELHKKGEKFVVGRSGGLYSPKFMKDCDSGGWKTFEYEVKFNTTSPPNRNWFSSNDFSKAVTGRKSGNILDVQKSSFINKDSYMKTITSSNDPWHFSHLGKSYFLDIAYSVGYGYKLDVPIKQLFIGKKGVPYIEKKKGRNVNPNWCVITSDGKEFKGGPSLGNNVEAGLWKLSNCNRFLWEEVEKLFMKVQN